MATKVTLAPYLESLSGRLCKNNGGTFQLQKKTGKVVLYDYHEGTQPNSEEQQAVKTAFSTRSKALSAWWAANKPSTTNEDGTAEYKELKTMFDAQSKVNGIYSFASSLVTSDLKLTLKSGDITLSGSSSGGSSTPTGGSEGV